MKLLAFNEAEAAAYEAAKIAAKESAKPKPKSKIRGGGGSFHGI